MTTNNKKLPAIFVTHGGGPCFFMDWNPADAWTKMADWLKNLSSTFEKPKAILVVSGHWEESEFTLLTNPNPPLFYDYFGFPEHTYKLKYDAPGSPELAEKVKQILLEKGIKVNEDSKRGYDHGVFIPFKLIYPDADIPILQLSLKDNLSPDEHIAIGETLSHLREEGILIVGSGSSYHNMRGFGPNGTDQSKTFDNWLTDVVSTENTDERNNKLKQWMNAPSGRFSHPREEHLIPLMVVAGTAGKNEKGRKIFSDNVMNVTLSAFQFG